MDNRPGLGDTILCAVCVLVLLVSIVFAMGGIVHLFTRYL